MLMWAYFYVNLWFSSLLSEDILVFTKQNTHYCKRLKPTLPKIDILLPTVHCPSMKSFLLLVSKKFGTKDRYGCNNHHCSGCIQQKPTPHHTHHQSLECGVGHASVWLILSSHKQQFLIFRPAVPDHGQNVQDNL